MVVVIENTSFKRVTLEGYGGETWPDQIAFTPALDTVGLHPDWQGTCEPALIVWGTPENDMEIAVSYRMLFFNGVPIDTDTLTVHPNSMRIVDPVQSFMGLLGEYPDIPGTFMINWGDGTNPDNVTLPYSGTELEHIYASAGTYTINAEVMLGTPIYGGIARASIDVVIDF